MDEAAASNSRSDAELYTSAGRFGCSPKRAALKWRAMLSISSSSSSSSSLLLRRLSTSTPLLASPLPVPEAATDMISVAASAGIQPKPAPAATARAVLPEAEVFCIAACACRLASGAAEAGGILSATVPLSALVGSNLLRPGRGRFVVLLLRNRAINDQGRGPSRSSAVTGEASSCVKLGKA